MQILMQNEDFIKKMNNLPPNISMYSFVKCLNDLHTHDRNSHDAVTSAANRSNMKFDDFCEHFFEHGFNKKLNPIPYTFGLIHKDALSECEKINSNNKGSSAFSTIVAITQEERGAYSKGSPDGNAKFIHSRINIKDMNYNL